MPVSRKSPSGHAGILADLARTVALASMATAASQSFSFALNAAQAGQGANAGDMVLIENRGAPAAGQTAMKGRISAFNTVTVQVDTTAVTMAAVTATLDTYVILQGET